ncbi:MAG: pirin family protein [Candidatus Woesearchaeota archaeon]
MKDIRKVINIIRSHPVLEGAGVKLNRVFSNENVELLDPFLLLDHFGSKNVEDYIKGFPWHPHRGIETVTYMLDGKVEHGDSLGNNDLIKPGEVQWMTAGSGIIHQEMPKPIYGNMEGFQLWVNLPKNKKMTKPRYMPINNLIKTKKDDAEIKIISGEINNKKGLAKDIFVNVDYFDVVLDGKFSYNTEKETVFIYLYNGEITVKGKKIAKNTCAVLDRKGKITVEGKGKFILVAGNPLREPIAWGGPIVMNTEQELNLAFEEIRDGSFIKN